MSPTTAQVLSKHLKYKNSYIPNETFWGLGIEHETYIEDEGKDIFTLGDMITKTAPERYSVRYFDNYKKGVYMKAMLDMYRNDHVFLIPKLWNSYGLQNCDANGNHQTLYERTLKKNPKFSGVTIWEEMKKRDSWFSEHYEKEYVFDGDTIEFMTLDFYNTTVDKVLGEYIYIKNEWEKRLQSALGENMTLMKKNYPFATYASNPGNVSMFNNGTIHINITLPTELDSLGIVSNWRRFEEQHRCLARAIQWLEPLWVAIYGSPDPLSSSKRFGGDFSRASQRCAVSRYVGIGTFDTEKMPRGKILQIPVSDGEFKWLPSRRADTAYTGRDIVGLDINFNKHWNHGLELRWFDQTSVYGMREILRALVALADFSLDVGNLPNPLNSELWVYSTGKILMEGLEYIMNEEEVVHWLKVFQCDQIKRSMSISELYEIIISSLCKKYKGYTCYNKFLGVSESGSEGDVKSEKSIRESSVVEVIEEVSKPRWFCC